MQVFVFLTCTYVILADTVQKKTPLGQQNPATTPLRQCGTTAYLVAMSRFPTSDLYLHLAIVSALMGKPFLKTNQPDVGPNTLGKHLGCHLPLNGKLFHDGAHPMECVFVEDSSVCLSYA